MALDPIRRPPVSRPARRREPAPVPPAGGPDGDWRRTLVNAGALNALAGIWLVIAPFVLGYGDADPYWNDIICGAIIGFVAMLRISGAYRAAWLSWLNTLAGVWIFASAIWLDDTSGAAWNDLILGLIVLALGLISATASESLVEEDGRGYRR